MRERVKKRRGMGERVAEGLKRGGWGGRQSSLARKNGGYGGRESFAIYEGEGNNIEKSRDLSFHFF